MSNNKAADHSVPTFGGLSGRRLAIARAVCVTLVLLALALFVAGLPALYDKFRTLSIFDDFGFDRREVHANLIQIGLSTEFYAGYYLALNAIFAMVCYATATIIFLRRSTESIALFAVVVLALHGAASSGAIDAVGMLHPLLGWLSSFLNLLGYATLLLLFYLFPDGRFVPRWTRWVVIIPVAYGISVSLFPSMPFSPGHRLYWPTLLGLLFTGVFAQVYRYWRFSSIVERQQTKWVVFGFVIAVTGTSVTIMITRVFSIQPGTLADLVVTAGLKGLMLLIPLSFAIAILKFHLWDIDVIINRTLVYGALTVCVAGMYVLVVGSVGVLLQPEGGLSQGSLLVSLLASGVVAILFAPLRERLQRGVNRLVYGERDDPYGVLSHLGKRLEATLAQGAVLPTIVETVASALKLPYAAIAIKQEDNFKVAAAYGSPVGEPTVLPLTYGSETIGQLILAPRAPGESFSAADRRLLEDLARNAEVAVHAVRLTADLQRSRERLVSAREEERRRLRRDLHDGLGPTLGSLALGLDVSLKLLKSELPEAEKLLYHLKAQTQDAVADIRRLVYGLRPPALDDLGLVPAIRQQASNHGTLADDLPGGAAGETNRKDRLIFFVEAPKNLPPLPAAVEVACYRIAQEAMTNVARHARASSCGIHLSHDAAKSELRLEVIDDGIGLPEDRRAGVGLSSMVERAEELGGTLSVGPPSTGGTRVVARLPLFAEGEG